MINGIDLLFIVIGLLLLWAVWEFSSSYSYWSKWDEGRRRERMRERFELQDKLREAEYRRQLRLLISGGLIGAIRAATRSFERFNETLRGFQQTP